MKAHPQLFRLRVWALCVLFSEVNVNGPIVRYPTCHADQGKGYTIPAIIFKPFPLDRIGSESNSVYLSGDALTNGLLWAVRIKSKENLNKDKLLL